MQVEFAGRKRSPTFSFTALTFGFVFLYAADGAARPSTHSMSHVSSVCGVVFQHGGMRLSLPTDKLMGAAKVSFLVATLAATLSTVLGTISGVIMSRHLSFKGRTLFSGLVTAPIIMPEIIIGLALLLLFASLARTLRVA